MEVLTQPTVPQPALEDAGAGLVCNWPNGLDGAPCGYIAKTRRALATHRTRAHGHRVMYRCAALTNQCPWCARIFASMATTQMHLQTRGSKCPPTCPIRPGPAIAGLARLVAPKWIECPFCEYQGDSLEDAHAHVRQHFAGDTEPQELHTTTLHHGGAQPQAVAASANRRERQQQGAGSSSRNRSHGQTTCDSHSKGAGRAGFQAEESGSHSEL
eukprot:6483422-Amphidinium_carterae.1